MPIIISAASGTGKTTLVNKLLKLDKKLQVSVSSTTRAKRKGESDYDYNFVSLDSFKRSIDNDEFLEHEKVHGNYYGSLKATTDLILNEGKDLIFIVDVNGGKAIKEKLGGPSIFLTLDSLSALEVRLRSRGTDSEEVILKRLATASMEIKIGLEDYDYVILNDVLEDAIKNTIAIIRTERLNKVDRIQLYKKIIEA